MSSACPFVGTVILDIVCKCCESARNAHVLISGRTRRRRRSTQVIELPPGLELFPHTHARTTGLESIIGRRAGSTRTVE